MLQLTCVVCGTAFESERANAVLCSSPCRLKHGAARMQRSRATQVDGRLDTGASP
jgi:predicted nucleic acid-binding Zn ribbon protein